MGMSDGNRRVWWIAAVLLAGAVVYVGSRPPKSAPTGSKGTVATTAPDFTLKSLDGRSVTLSSYRGKVVLLDFWATWCTPCRAEIPRFIEWQQKYGDKGLVVLGVSMDDSSKDAANYAREMKISYPVVMGTNEVADAYGGVLGLPVNLLIARDGHVVTKDVGATDLAALEKQIANQLGR
jgi:cytochrome c biogenesis protein CcmG, thiol:disulfide interchange protein DsbE